MSDGYGRGPLPWMGQKAMTKPDIDGRCPKCNSPDPKQHPAVQFEGEVQICDHSFHSPAPDIDGLVKRLSLSSCIGCRDAHTALTHLQEENGRLVEESEQWLERYDKLLDYRHRLGAHNAQLVAALEALLGGKAGVEADAEVALSATPEQTKAAAEVIQIAREIYRKSLTDSDTKDDETRFLEAVGRMEGE